jgi:endonuclease-3
MAGAVHGLSARLRGVSDLLAGRFGRPELCVHEIDPVRNLVLTILSQNTTDANSSTAYAALRRRFPQWDSVRRAPVASIASAIRPAGLAQLKAPRIRAILREIHRTTGALSLEFLRDMPVADAAEYLARFEGVGPKTVACVLLFACGKPVLPVDTHVHRVSRRIGLIAAGTGAAEAHGELAAIVPRGSVLEFHVQLIRHGRRICAARRPACDECLLVDLCAEGRRRR